MVSRAAHIRKAPGQDKPHCIRFAFTTRDLEMANFSDNTASSPHAQKLKFKLTCIEFKAKFDDFVNSADYQQIEKEGNDLSDRYYSQKMYFCQEIKKLQEALQVPEETADESVKEDWKFNLLRQCAQMPYFIIERSKDLVGLGGSTSNAYRAGRRLVLDLGKVLNKNLPSDWHAECVKAWESGFP